MLFRISLAQSLPSAAGLADVLRGRVRNHEPRPHSVIAIAEHLLVR
ncbi:hypothetical protein [Actinomyces gaoshouyii]|nr:hypothetical protein [Actinomyces gaoshouyii]